MRVACCGGVSAGSDSSRGALRLWMSHVGQWRENVGSVARR